jgi:hypothetical protein
MMYLHLIERQRPQRLIYQEALLARTSPSHKSYPLLKEKVRRRSAGFAGEIHFDRVCAEYGIDTPFEVIADFKMPAHQIDAICIFSSFIAIVEVKNISGHIQMDGTKRQFTRTLNGTVTGMTNPDDQLYRHEKLIRRLIGGKIPIIGIVVFANPSAILEIKNIKRRVIHLSGLPFALDELASQYQFSSKIDIEHYYSYLLSLQPPLHPPAPPRISYPLLEGVFCSLCSYTKMTYSRTFWRCSNCERKQADAHLLALQDYRLLIGPTISNREFRKFTGLQSRTTAWTILQSCGFQTIGNQKGLRYVIPEMDLRKS